MKYGGWEDERRNFLYCISKYIAPEERKVGGKGERKQLEVDF